MRALANDSGTYLETRLDNWDKVLLRNYLTNIAKLFVRIAQLFGCIAQLCSCATRIAQLVFRN